MNRSVCRALICVVFLVLSVGKLSAQENADENFAAEIVNTDENVTVKTDDEVVEHPAEVDDDHNEGAASGETAEVDIEVVHPRGDANVTGRSGNYQYDEFLSGIDYMGNGFPDFNTGYDMGE